MRERQITAIPESSFSRMFARKFGGGYLRRILYLAALAFVTAEADAATINEHDGVLYLTGRIEVGDGQRFGDTDIPNPRLVVLDSDGGMIGDALIMARMIHNVGVATLIPAGRECLSACAMLFLASRERYMGGGAVLGVHNGWDETGSSSAGTTAMSDFLTDLAAAPLDVILQVSITPPGQMWILPRERWAEMHITEWTAPRH